MSLLRQKLLEAGTNSISTLPKVFRSYQSCDPTALKVDINDFFDGLQKYGIYLRKEEMKLIAKYFEKNNDGKMYYDEFLYAIRGKPNEERQSVIDLVFYKFDKNKTGFADASEMRKVFNCVKHPRYLMKDYTEDQIFYLYLQNFDNEPKGSVTKKVKLILI
jgi:Ca2+-binding EF-hand superfamily protein